MSYPNWLFSLTRLLCFAVFVGLAILAGVVVIAILHI
jgi:hypothetical protein